MIKSNKIKRKLRNRKKLKTVNVNRLRISVYKSLNNLSAQIIDDKQKKTLVSASSFEKEIKEKKVKKMDKSSLTGEILAKRAKEKKISNVYFDRGEYKYHGRVKIFAETPVNNCTIIEDEIYGIIPRAKIAILVTAPPENILNMPNKPFWLELIISFNDKGSIPARGT